jgi:predicted phosphodiesterase
VSELEKILFLPDPHRPFHHKPAWELMLQAMTDWKPDTIVIQGDFCDFYKLSKFKKDPRREHSFEDEVEDCLTGLFELGLLGAKRKIYIGGNHEERLATYLAMQAPELFAFVTVPKLFQLEERGWEYVPYKESIKIGKLYCTHDAGIVGRYAVQRTADAFQHPVVFAHTHRLSYIVEGNATGEHFPAATFGWMGDVEQVDYMHKIRARREWTLGFGTGLMGKDGNVHLTPHPIVNGKSVVVEGGEYRV